MSLLEAIQILQGRTQVNLVSGGARSFVCALLRIGFGMGPKTIRILESFIFTSNQNDALSTLVPIFQHPAERCDRMP